jgi:uncharacterized membrane protein YqaE (UPF0057 family)
MLFLLAIVCPPLAVLATGSPSRAAANVGLTALLYFPGMIHALNEVDRYSTTRRYDSVMRQMERQAV